MRPGFASVAAWLLLSMALPAMALDSPTGIHGDAGMQSTPFGRVFDIESDFSQIRLSPTLVATARKGTAFAVYAPLIGESSAMVQVDRGSVTVIDEGGDRARTVQAGGRMAFPLMPVASDAAAQQRSGGASTDIEDAYGQWLIREARQGYILSDSIMTRQQEYLASLQINILDINRALVSFIRRLLFR